jgi:uroporphyrinogen decarboxylase
MGGEMTSYERVTIALDAGKPDRVPVIPFMRDWGMNYAGFTWGEVLRNPNKYVYAQYKTLRDMGHDVLWDLMGAHSESEAMGSVLQIQETSPPSVKEFAVKDLRRDVDKLRLPNPNRDGRLPQLLKVVRSLKALGENEVPVIGYVQGPFRHAAMLRGHENLLMDMLDEPETCQKLLGIATDSLILYGASLIDAGADLIMIAEPYLSKDIMSKGMAEAVAPHFARLARTLRKLGTRVFVHLCGVYNDRFDTIKGMEVNGVSLDEKNDLVAAREMMGLGVCLIGNIAPAETLVNGTPAKVIRESNEIIEKVGKHGSFILASGCMIPKIAPKENIEALIQVAKENKY